MEPNNEKIDKNFKVVSIAFVVILVLIVAIRLITDDSSKNEAFSSNIVASNNGVNATPIPTQTPTPQPTIAKKKVTVIDFSKMSKEEIKKWCNENNITFDFDEDYSSEVKKGDFISQSVEPSSTILEDDTITITYSLGKKPSTEELNALAKAETYSELMNMSKSKIYDQLTSDYGEGFDKDAAQYAIDNIKADWNYNALQKAKSYQSLMNMSKKKIYEQLISEYGEKFTKSQAQYAIDHLDD